MSLSITNVIRVFILSALRGLADINTSILALITDDIPLSNSYGTFGIYKDPTGVAADFGSTSSTYTMAVAVFSQNPNILTGNGYLVIIPRNSNASATAATLLSTNNVDLTTLTNTDYYIRAAVNGGASSKITIGSIDSTSMASALTSLNNAAITAAGLVFSLSGVITSAKITLQTLTTGAAKNITLGQAVTSSDGTDLALLLNLPEALKVNGSDAGVESVKDCILRTMGSVSYFGIILNKKLTDAVQTELSALVQSIDKMLFIGSSLIADIAGIFTTLMQSGYTHTRCLLYTNSAALALTFAASYASRALSVNFDGSNTVLTMHLKDLVGLVADTLFAGSTGQTYLDAAQLAGVDMYADFGVPKVFTSGANGYFDAVYIGLALKLKLAIAAFNFLAQTTTKIPQTEEGMNGLKNTLRKVMQAFVTNGAFAPGTWTGSTTFGNPVDHQRNITERGFFIYSLPVALQSQTQRTARIAPAIQIAAKSSGAIHSADVTVLIEA